MNPLSNAIRTFEPCGILVFGDLMLDEYCRGEVKRISPEAPIPVLDVASFEHKPGGAASACANLAALGCLVFPMGRLGKDEAGDTLETLFRNQGVDPSTVYRSRRFKTTLKRRLVANWQQLLRMDVDQEDVPASREELEAFRVNVGKILPRVGAVLVSDYSKGACSREALRWLIDESRKRNLPVVCDPGKGKDYERYRGVTAIKPNREECEAVAGRKIVDQASLLDGAEFVKKKTEAEFVVVSLDREGALFFPDRQTFRMIPTETREICDVTGAGDMMASVLTALLASGCEAWTAAQVANSASGLEVTRLGACALNWQQIGAFIEKKDRSEKIIFKRELPEKIPPRNERKSPVVFVNGYFEEFNGGVLKFLLELERFYGTLVVGVNSDLSIRRAKGSPPLIEEFQRARLLANFHSVDWVVLFDEPDANDLIETLRPDVYVKSEIYRERPFAESETVSRLSVELAYLPYFQ